MRIKCWLFGCCAIEQFPDYDECQVCGAYVHDPEWIYGGWWNSLIYLAKTWLCKCDRFVLGQKCEVCGKRFRVGRACSDKCKAEVPF